MKSRIQTYGKTAIIILAAIFAGISILCCLPWISPEEVAAIFGGFAVLVTGTTTVIGLTIIRYGARETALSFKGGWKPEMVIKKKEV